MAAKKSTKKKQAKNPPASAEQVADMYWDYVLTKGHEPASVYAFCKYAELTEGDFYQHHSSFSALESRYWESLVRETIDVLEADDDYAEYDIQQKLLAFYFTFFTHVQRHRSRLVECFPCMRDLKPDSLRAMRQTFTSWADELMQEGLASGQIADRKKLNELYAKGLFEQLRFLIDYYRKDTSDGFQDTDALIEKSVRFFADSASSGVLDSALDLARFMMRRLQP